MWYLHIDCSYKVVEPLYLHYYFAPKFVYEGDLDQDGVPEFGILLKRISNCCAYALLSIKNGHWVLKTEPFERYKAIALIVHFLGDMHSPMHVVYLPANTVKGHINVIYKGKKTILHAFWDSAVFDSNLPKGFGDMAFLADTASPKEIKAITEVLAEILFVQALRTRTPVWFFEK